MKLPKDPLLSKVFGDVKFEGETVEQMVARMDECAIQASIITVNAASREPFQPYRVGQKIDDAALDAACKDVADMMARYPGRFFGCVAVDPTGMMKSVRRLERVVREYGFNVCFILPAGIGLPPNHACYFPIYAKCVELGIPVRMNVGLPAFQGAGWVQHPMHLDEVLLAFPELTVVGAHVGHPWHVECVALLQKYPNFYLLTSGWVPKRVPQELWQFANTRGANKLMWASDYPLLPMERTAMEGWEVPLKEEVKRRYLRENAIETFKLKLAN
ncbi:MAG TPA: amidohydrolase family protein [Candidatus Binataceae bacterium]|nr:amidohydrolase family protein [Candidatus Binataceae bacterium]